MSTTWLAKPPPAVWREGDKNVWMRLPGDKYIVTGVDRKGRRFRQVYDEWAWARGVNVWRGSKWLLREGRRHLIYRVWN